LSYLALNRPVRALYESDVMSAFGHVGYERSGIVLGVVVMVALLLGFPVLIAYGLASLERWLARLGYIPNPALSAWDFVFERTRREGGVWLVFEPRDGKLIGGKFGSSSFAGDAAGERDIYLQEAWQVADDGSFLDRIGEFGVLIREADYRRVFVKVDREGDGNGAT
jgi:hypothetical protein